MQSSSRAQPSPKPSPPPISAVAEPSDEETSNPTSPAVSCELSEDTPSPRGVSAPAGSSVTPVQATKKPTSANTNHRVPRECMASRLSIRLPIHIASNCIATSGFTDPDDFGYMQDLYNLPDPHYELSSVSFGLSRSRARCHSTILLYHSRLYRRKSQRHLDRFQFLRPSALGPCCTGNVFVDLYQRCGW